MAETVDILLRARMEANEVTSSIGQIQKSLQSLTLPKGLSNDLEKEFSKIGPLLKDYQKQLNKGFSNKKDLQTFSALKEQIGDTLGTIKTLVNQANSQQIRLKVDTQAIDQLQNKIVSKTEALQKALSQVFTKSVNADNIATQFDKVLQSTSRSTSVKGMIGNAGKLFNAQEYAAYNAELDKIKNKILSLSTSKVNFAKSLGVKDAEKDIAAVEAKITSFFNKLKVNEGKVQSIELLKKELREMGVELEQLDISSKLKGAEEVNSLHAGLQQIEQDFHNTGNAANDAASGILSMKDQVGQLRQSTQYFFSLRNMINLFKRGIDDAVKSVKELDAAMTETAVVTTNTVGDMWNMLPEYTKNANALGATVLDMYKATTLYYQQGLNAEQSMSIAAETMKMARIGGLEAADATDKMTAALRGFNMEINELSAQRINDVYSNLAAKTASNTEELGSAMQRTASIAHSAGMSFEGTAAFLAQAIETTREPAENLGTAMKTIVARFQELKENPLEIVEVDGEEVSYNKVDTALQSIGVSLKDANGQFRNLDKVFLEIAQRWDSLTQTQQRYIATTAAGSRQQSRFIAMMSNYERTMQLMSYANDSAGASNEQFNKTMDSLEAKLNKLHNAWQAFMMGIANNTFVKGAVDGLTFVISQTNTLINTLSGGRGVIKSFLSLFTAFTALKGLGRFANAAIGGLGGMLDPQSSFKQGFFGGGIIGNKANANATQARMISDPIVNAINRLYQAQTGKTVTKDSQTSAKADYKAFTEANTGLRGTINQLKPGEQFSIGEAYSKIDKLDTRQQKAVLQQLPGLTLSLQKNGIKFNTKDISRSSQELLKVFNKEINDGLKNGNIDSQTALKMFGSPQEFAKAMSARGDDYARAAQEVLGNSFDRSTYREDLANKLLQVEKFKNMDKDSFNNYLDKAVAKRNERDQQEFAGFATSQISNGAKLANNIASVGQAATMAGQGVAQLGMQLSNAGFKTAGAAVTDLGYKISSLGMIASSVGSVFGKIFANDGPMALINAHPVMAMVTAIAAIAGTVAFINKQIKENAKNSAQEIQQAYSESVKEASDKIDSLKANVSTFKQLSKGVDKYGHNLSLTEEEYDQFLSTSKALAETSPSLIKGYDAQGRAIIATGDAVDQLIKKQEDLRNTARDNYITGEAFSTNIAGIRAGENYESIVSSESYIDEYGTTQFKQVFMGKQIATFNKAVKKIDNKKLKNLNAEITKLTGHEIDLANINDQSVKVIASRYQDINRLVEENSQKLDDKTREGLQKAFSGIGEDYNSFLSDLQPLTEQLGLFLDSKGLSVLGLGISEEFVAGFNKGLEDLALTSVTENWGGSRLQREAENYAKGFRNLTKEGSAYSRTLEQIDRIQQDYLKNAGETGAIEDYNKNIQEQINHLNSLANQYDGTSAAGTAFAEMCRSAAADAQMFTEYGVALLGEGLNTLASEFSQAREAQKRFEEATAGGDYYTAAEGYKSIMDTVMNEKNDAGQGSLTAWRGATELLGASVVDNAKSWDEVASKIQKIAPMFEDGAEGVLAFNDFLVEAWHNAGGASGELAKLGSVIDGEFHFDFDTQNESLEKFAKLLGISEGALAALIDKSRQWVPWDISDPDMIMSALRNSETTIQGSNGTLYTAESAFRDEAYRNEIVGDNYKETRKTVEDRGVKLLTVDELTAKSQSGIVANDILKDLNISSQQQNNTLDNAVRVFSGLGFGLEDITTVLTKQGMSLQEGPVTAEQIAEVYDQQAFAAENPTVAGIASDTGIIASNTSALLTSMGILDKNTKEKVDEVTSDKYVDNAFLDYKRERKGATNQAEREQALNNVQAKIDKYDSDIERLKQGQSTHKEDTATWKEYQETIDKLEKARNNLSGMVEKDQQLLIDTAEQAQTIIQDIGISNENTDFLNANALDVSNALNNTDINAGIASLAALRQEGSLTKDTMFALASEFQKIHNTDLSQLTYGELANLYTQLGLGKEQCTELYASLNGLSEDEIEILINPEVEGKEKVDQFLDELAKTPKQKEIFIEAAAKIAGGNAASAKDTIMQQLGFSSEQAEIITQKIEVALETESLDTASVIDAVDSIPSYKGINVNANIANAMSGIDQTKGNISSIPDEHGTNITADNSDLNSKSAQATSNINSIPDSHGTNITATDSATSVISRVRTALSRIPSVVRSIIKVDKEAARGLNYSIPAHQTPSFGSAANGFNTTGSSKRSMTALVGEEGFEIAYIPSQARSMILGANGPEITSFPSDTVIYPHKQSLDIIRRGKQKNSFDSFAQGRSGGLRSSVIKYVESNNARKSGGSSSNNKSNNKSNAGNKAAKAVEDTAKRIGGVSVWWENIARKTEATQRKADNNQKNFDKYIKDMRATLKKTGTVGQGDAYISNLKNVISLNQQQVKKATQQLLTLDIGTDAYRKAKNAEERAKANERAFNGATPGVAQVSYSTGSGDNKKTVDELVNLAPFIKKDKTGAYVVDQGVLNSVKNQERRKGIADAANKEVNDLTNKRNKAEDEIKKAQEALEKMGEELYNTFFAWETELTKIWNITQKIERAEEKLSRQKAYSELLTAQLNSGLQKATKEFNKKSVAAFKTEIKQETKILRSRVNSISVLRDNVTKALSTADEKATLKSIKAKLASDKKYDAARANLQKKAEAKTKARNRVKKAKAGVSSAQAQLKAAKKTGNAKQIAAAQTKLNNANRELANANKALTNATKAYNTASKSLSQYKNLNATEKLGYETYAKKLQEDIDIQNAASKYLTATRLADGTVDFNFNSSRFEQDKLAGNISADKAKKIEEYVEKVQKAVEELNTTYKEITDVLTDMHDRLADLKDQWANYARDLWEYVEEKKKDDVENLKKLSSSISNALKKLLDEVKRKLDERRRVEDNAKTESDISRKQQRLAMLRADTSGGNLVEIAQLEQELATAQQNYQRSLEDQLLDKLQQQADLAAQQRERLIELSEAQLEATNNAALVDMWMANPEAYKSEILKAYRANNKYDISPQAIKDSINRDFETFWNGLTTNQQEQKLLTNEITGIKDIVNKIEKELANSSVSLSSAKSSGYSAKGAKNLFGASLSDLRTIGKYTAADFLKSNYKAKDLKAAGFSASEAIKAGVSLKDLKSAGYTAANLKQAGVKIENAKKAGYTNAELAQGYGATAAMINLNMSGKAVQNATGASAASLQKIVNKSATDKAVQTDMSGVTAKMDTNGKTAGGSITGTIGTTGKQIAANRGSTLYVQGWDTKTGKANGKQAVYTIDKLTAALIKSHPQEAKQALIYAIQNQAWGSKINKNFKGLVSAAKIGGNSYKLASKGHAWYASVGSDGVIYQNHNSGVVTWNPATGKTSTIKYDKAKFLAKAKKNDTVSREYAQVLIDKKAYTKTQLQKAGVKKFASGGLADFTGPAWLDGTNSKPELVLNAQDTKNFLALKDVLSRAVKSTNDISNGYGNAVYEININVDHINNDYDVDRIAERVKRNIVKDSNYRNITQVRKFR